MAALPTLQRPLRDDAQPLAEADCRRRRNQCLHRCRVNARNSLPDFGRRRADG